MMTKIFAPAILVCLLLSRLLSTNPVFAFENDKQEAAKYYKSAQKHEAAKKYAHAVNSYYRALVMDQESAFAHRQIGRIFIGKGLFKDSLHHLQQALFLDKDNAETHYYLGAVYFLEHDVARALHHYQECLRLNPASPKKEAQVRHWIEKLSRAKETARGHVRQGRSFLAAKNVAAARKDFEQALLFDPDNAQAHCGLGVALAVGRVPDNAKAIEHLQRYLTLRPDAEDAHEVRQWIGKLRLKPASPQAPPGADFYHAKAKAIAKTDKAKAMQNYWKYLELKPRAKDLQDVLDRIAKLE